MKTRFVLVLTALAFFVLILTACQGQSTDQSTISSEADVPFEGVTIYMDSFINDINEGKPIVTIHGDDGPVASFDLSTIQASQIEITLSSKPSDNCFYVTMSGNVTKHSLESDGSMFDGIAVIKNGKAEFQVEYEGKYEYTFIVNV